MRKQFGKKALRKVTRATLKETTGIMKDLEPVLLRTKKRQNEELSPKMVRKIIDRFRDNTGNEFDNVPEPTAEHSKAVLNKLIEINQRGSENLRI